MTFSKLGLSSILYSIGCGSGFSMCFQPSDSAEGYRYIHYALEPPLHTFSFYLIQSRSAIVLANQLTYRSVRYSIEAWRYRSVLRGCL